VTGTGQAKNASARHEAQAQHIPESSSANFSLSFRNIVKLKRTNHANRGHGFSVQRDAPRRASQPRSWLPTTPFSMRTPAASSRVDLTRNNATEGCASANACVAHRSHRALIDPAGGLGGTSGMGVGLSRQRTANVSEAIAAQASQASELKRVMH
jgi:hypothetical protein